MALRKASINPPLDELIRHVVSGDYTGDVDSCVHAITSQVDVADPESFCWQLWQTVIDAAKGTGPYPECLPRLQRLVLLVSTIKKSESPVNSDGEVLRCWHGQLWKDLPILGPAMRENWNDPTTPADLQPCINRHIFTALLTAEGVHDFALFGLWTLREALEGDFPWHPPPSEEIAIPLAHVWIIHASANLVHRRDDYGRAGQGGSKWKGSAGFSEERWRFWMKRFEVLASGDTLNPSCTRSAAEAAGHLKRLLD